MEPDGGGAAPERVQPGAADPAPLPRRRRRRAHDDGTWGRARPADRPGVASKVPARARRATGTAWAPADARPHAGCERRRGACLLAPGDQEMSGPGLQPMDARPVPVPATRRRALIAHVIPTLRIAGLENVVARLTDRLRA